MLSACGSSSAGGSTTGTTPTRAAFTVGMICSCSGSQRSSEGDNGTVMQAWARWVNAHGGINGYPVKVIIKDDGQNPATSLAYAKELVTRDHAIAIVGETSQVDAAWADYIAGTGVPVVGGQAQNAPFLSNPDFFPSGAQISPVAAVAGLASTSGKHHLGVYYCAESTICAHSVAPVTAMARLRDVRLTAGAVSADQPSYAAPCLAAKGAGVDAMWVADTAPVVQRFVADCKQQGYSPQQVGELGSGTADWLTDHNLEGMLLTSNNADTWDTSLPALTSFYAALRKYAPSTLTSSSAVDKPNTLFPWSGGLLFQAAAKAGHLTPSSSPADVKKGLYALKNETLGGIAPPLTFAPGRPTFVRCYFVDQLKGGAFVPLNAGKPSCLSASEAAAVAAATEH